MLYFIGVMTINWISPVYPKVKEFNMQVIVVLVVTLLHDLFHKEEFVNLLIANMRPAFIIHLWLPLFALSSLFVKLVFWIFRAVEWAQWFLKQGDEHPLKAIGMVATIIVFGKRALQNFPEVSNAILILRNCFEVLLPLLPASVSFPLGRSALLSRCVSFVLYDDLILFAAE